MGHGLGVPRALQVLADLKAAADVGAGHHRGTGVGQIVGLQLPERVSFLRLHQVVDAGAAAAHAGFAGLADHQVRDLSQQGPGLGADALAVERVASIVVGHREWPVGRGRSSIGMA